ncbi:hypothetical protein [Pseudopedobacter sp.]|uniref:hypothetical protein n=1 Tax=Pseudopedobacter sp. TaxID=1936787 RepID=UPI003340AB26
MLTKEINIEKSLSDHLISLINHDIRAPMKNFAYFLSLYEKEEIGNQNFDFIEMLQVFFNSSSFLMENYILWKRIIDRQLGYKQDSFVLLPIANEIKVAFLSYLVDKQVHLGFNFDTNQCLETSEEVFRFVLKNVIYTILNYSNKGNAVYVELKEEGKCLEVRSIDLFIPPGKLAFMFNMEEYKNVSGKDIGVLLSIHLLKIFNGEILYEQYDSGESIFKLYFN